ncbi:NADPH-dependent F420 reductase [Marinibactrum halimedae]|uniref:Pyrroline-5-carboxylate reductase catalytic N-terminal domain-containing protein n=1 Tax=Marinibactrum halimedae TaxID=1444977 RepID=A0AA37T3B7_9GAMM|nr:NAD(P)-binding domain-containing protein [Marinibactrum halimedae]MCD9461153.1 NAD(P)-binding domain-containing protein [Marinibactrum halimedae]GLS26040.1 hypothetical protein GCM10007877_17550 [Marinibactrum halimedae]
MKIGIIGTGNMGRAIGVRLSLVGHQVFFGARDKQSTEFAQSFAPNALSGSLQQAAEFGDILFYSIRDVPSAGIFSDLTVFDDKIIVDLNNGPIPEGYHYAPIVESKTEKLQTDIPKAKVVKAFNGLAMEVYDLPKETLQAHNVTIFVASSHADARQKVASLASDIGFTPVELKSNHSARLLEAHADLVRQIMGEAKLGPMAHISADVLPSPEGTVVGVRQTSNYK